MNEISTVVLANLGGPMRRAGLVLIAGLCCLVSGYADIYGTSPLPSSAPVTDLNDYCTGCLFAYAQATNSTPQYFTSWSFDTLTTYDDHGAVGGNDMITPLLFSSSFQLIGIGATQTVTPGEEVRNASFGAFIGTNVVTNGDYLGWRDGSAATPGNGVIALSVAGGPGILAYTCDNSSIDAAGTPCYNSAPLVLNQTYTPGFDAVGGRTYEVNFTTTTPEPGFYGITALGLVGLAGIIVRRKKATV